MQKKELERLRRSVEHVAALHDDAMDFIENGIRDMIALRDALTRAADEVKVDCCPVMYEGVLPKTRVYSATITSYGLIRSRSVCTVRSTRAIWPVFWLTIRYAGLPFEPIPRATPSGSCSVARTVF